MSAAADLIDRLMAAINAEDSGALSEVLHPELVSHGALGDVFGPDGFREVMLTNIKRAFPDARVRALDIIESGAMVSWRIEGSGTHSGPFLGIDPTGRTVRINGIHHGRLEEGQLIEHWQGPDILGMLLDMGVLPAATEKTE